MLKSVEKVAETPKLLTVVKLTLKAIRYFNPET